MGVAGLEARVPPIFQLVLQVQLTGIALVPVYHQPPDQVPVLREPLLLTERGVPLAVLGVVGVGGRQREGPVDRVNGPAGGEEVEQGPGKDPQEAEVEDPADPGGGAPAVDGVRRVDVNGALFERKADQDVAAVVGRADQGLDALADEGFVEAGDGAGDAEAVSR